MTYPSGNTQGIPPQYQGSLTWVPSDLYQGGGYWAHYGGGPKFDYAQLERLWISGGGDKSLAPLMAAIAQNESGGSAGAWNSTGATGLWQIEYPGSAPAGDTREQLFGPLANAQAAVALSGNTRAGIEQNWRGDAALGPGSPGVKNTPPTAGLPLLTVAGKNVSQLGPFTIPGLPGLPNAGTLAQTALTAVLVLAGAAAAVLGAARAAKSTRGGP